MPLMEKSKRWSIRFVIFILFISICSLVGNRLRPPSNRSVSPIANVLREKLSLPMPSISSSKSRIKKELKAIFSWDCLLSSLHIILEQFTMLKLGESRSRCRLLGDHYQTYWSIMRTMNILSLVFFIIHCQHYDQVSRVIYDKDPVTTMCTNCRTTVTTIVTAEVNTHYQHRNHSHFHHHNNVHLHCCLDRLVWSLGLLQGLAVLQVISSSVKKVLGPDTNKNI